MKYLAILSLDADGMIEKYQDFPTMAEATAHVETFKEAYPDAFAISLQDSVHELSVAVNAQTKEVTQRGPKQPVAIESKVARALRIIAAASSPGLRKQIEDELA